MPKVVALKDFSKELKKYGEENIELYKKTIIDNLQKNLIELIKNSPVDTGLYAQSWELLISEKEAFLGNDAPHAAIIEYGARPYTPPIGPLLNWARRVLKQPENTSHVWALARYTQNKIEEFGMDPKHILTDATEKIVNDIRLDLKRRFG